MTHRRILNVILLVSLWMSLFNLFPAGVIPVHVQQAQPTEPVSTLLGSNLRNGYYDVTLPQNLHVVQQFGTGIVSNQPSYAHGVLLWGDWNGTDSQPESNFHARGVAKGVQVS